MRLHVGEKKIDRIEQGDQHPIKTSKELACEKFKNDYPDAKPDCAEYFHIHSGLRELVHPTGRTWDNLPASLGSRENSTALFRRSIDIREKR